jgi:N-acetylneuraminate synthase
MKIKIDNKWIGDDCPCYVIAEIGSNFDGSIERAKKLIDLAKEAGADAVKFQCFKTEKIVSKEGFEGLKSGFQSKWDKPVCEVYRNAEFPRDWNKELFEYSKKKGITFFSSPYDKEAVDLLDKIGVPAMKIGSGDITWLEMLDYIARKGRPVILGTGASTLEEVEEAVNAIKATGNDKLILLQCVTNYPSSFDDANIRAMVMLREKFGTLVGYSDHTPGYIVPMGSVALGGCIIEKHFTDDKTRKGPDHPFAMDFEDLKLMVKNIRLLEKALGKPVKELYPEENETVILQRRCIRAKENIPKGKVITKDMLDVLRPAPTNALYPKYVPKIIGKEASRDIKKGEAIYSDMIQGLKL